MLSVALGSGLGRSWGLTGLSTGWLGVHGFGALAQSHKLPTPLMPQIRVSAASDLKFALADVLNQFQRDTGLPVVATYGSSGQFARQIVQGLPTDLFMSADEALVMQLADKGLTQDKGVVYAVGRLALIVSRKSAAKVISGSDWPGVQDALARALAKAPTQSHWKVAVLPNSPLPIPSTPLTAAPPKRL